MGNYKSRRPGYLPGWQMDVATYIFQGKTEEQIAMLIWQVLPEDEKGMRNAKTRLRNLRKNEQFKAYYSSLVTEWQVHNVGPALNKLVSQLECGMPWLENKAANDILQKMPKAMFGSEEDNTIKVVVEGAPELGTPDE